MCSYVRRARNHYAYGDHATLAGWRQEQVDKLSVASALNSDPVESGVVWAIPTTPMDSWPFWPFVEVFVSFLQAFFKNVAMHFLLTLTFCAYTLSCSTKLTVNNQQMR